MSRANPESVSLGEERNEVSKVECQSCGESVSKVYQYGHCKSCLVDRFQVLKSVIDEFRSSNINGVNSRSSRNNGATVARTNRGLKFDNS